jgi:hypothetical protein
VPHTLAALHPKLGCINAPHAEVLYPIHTRSGLLHVDIRHPRFRTKGPPCTASCPKITKLDDIITSSAALDLPPFVDRLWRMNASPSKSDGPHGGCMLYGTLVATLSFHRSGECRLSTCDIGGRRTKSGTGVTGICNVHRKGCSRNAHTFGAASSSSTGQT